MSDMPVQAIPPERLAVLRSRAASRLTGPAATKGSPARAADALSVLHALASSPATAADALTLLHELQVLQVELDLQALELQESRAELESALRRQIELYDHQPAGSFTIDAHSVMHELNQAGADMLGLGRDFALGLSLDAFLDAESARWLKGATAGLQVAAPQQASHRLTLQPKDGPERPVLASIGADTVPDRFLVSLMHDGELRTPKPA